MSEQQQHSNLPTYQRASAPSPSEPGSRFPSEIPEAAKQTTPERLSAKASTHARLIAGDKLDALMEVALELKEKNRKLKEKIKELEEEKNQHGSA